MMYLKSKQEIFSKYIALKKSPFYERIRHKIQKSKTIENIGI